MIKAMTKDEFTLFWPTFHRIILAQESYAFCHKMTKEQAYEIWCKQPLKTFAFVKDQEVLGSYYIKVNSLGPSDHICNCGYMVADKARGKGIATTLCEHSQNIARQLGFSAMQFNSVVATNIVAVKLWQSLGFNIVGTIPNAYRHATLGFVDSYVMHKVLE